MSIETLPDQCFDDRLAAHVEILSCPVQFFQQAGRHVHVDPLDRLNHAALAFEEGGDVSALMV